MNRYFGRSEILDRLRSRVARNRPILCATAGNGLIARSLEVGGADLLLTSVTGIARQRGLPSIGWHMDRNNEAVEGIIAEIAEVTQDVPIIASVAAGEPAVDADLGEIVAGFVKRGYSGILNYPTLGGGESELMKRQHEQYLARAQRSGASDYAIRVAEALRIADRRDSEIIQSGRGYPRELELIRAAHERDVFTMAYAWTPEQARVMVGAGADVIIGHCGGTAGGAAGEALISYEEAAQWLQGILVAAREARPDILLMGHGGPFSTWEDTKRLYALTDAIGFLSGSAIERIPVERAVREATVAFSDMPLKP